MNSEDDVLTAPVISFQDFQPGGLRTTTFSARLRFGRSRSSKVIDFGINRMRVYATSY